MALLTFDKTAQVFIYYGIFQFYEFSGISDVYNGVLNRFRNNHIRDLKKFQVLVAISEKNKNRTKKKSKK